MDATEAKPPVAKRVLVVYASRLAASLSPDNPNETLVYQALDVLATENEEAIFPYIVGAFVAAARQRHQANVAAFRQLDAQLLAVGAKPQELVLIDQESV